MTLRPIAAILLSLSGLTAQNPATALLTRRYQEGATLAYMMRGENDGRKYAVRLHSLVKKGPDGRMGEEYSFSDASANGQPQTLQAGSQSFRAIVTLESGGAPFVLPDLSKVPDLVGPVLDLVTFYADLFLAINVNLHDVGEHALVPNPTVASWADGTRVLIGEDAIDFDIHLTDIDRREGIATLLIKHVPPKETKIRIPAEWMRPPVVDAPNNWVEVQKSGDSYVAGVGQEIFDVTLRIRLADGVMLSAAMDNPVVKIERHCKDAQLLQCDDSHPGRNFRRIEMNLEP